MRNAFGNDPEGIGDQHGKESKHHQKETKTVQLPDYLIDPITKKLHRLFSLMDDGV